MQILVAVPGDADHIQVAIIVQVGRHRPQMAFITGRNHMLNRTAGPVIFEYDMPLRDKDLAPYDIYVTIVSYVAQNS